MTDIPIIFSAPMVQALLSNRKSMTRRLAWRSETDHKKMDFVCDNEKPPSGSRLAKGMGVQMAGAYWLRPTPLCRAKPGDRLWVRETLRLWDGFAEYAADDARVPDNQKVQIGRYQRQNMSPLHMPRAVSRLTLIVTATKIERLQEISEDDAKAEGARHFPDIECRHPYPQSAARWSMENPASTDECLASARFAFGNLWEKLRGHGSWHTNPEVVAISFQTVKANIDAPILTHMRKKAG